MAIVSTAPPVREEPRRTQRRKRDKEGQRRKEAALNSHDVHHGAELLIVRRQFAEHLLSEWFASLNDVDLPPWLCGNYLGSVHRPFANAGIIVERRMVPNQRPNCNRRRIVEWLLVDPDAIRQWLFEHPAAIATEDCEAAPVVDVPSSGPTHQRSLFGGETQQ